LIRHDLVSLQKNRKAFSYILSSTSKQEINQEVLASSFESKVLNNRLHWQKLEVSSEQLHDLRRHQLRSANPQSNKQKKRNVLTFENNEDPFAAARRSLELEARQF